MKTFEAKTAARWRKWLTDHHDSATEIWLIFRKQHTGRPSISYEESVDEALCFGWIDSLIKRIDDERYARKFTPRKPDSAWSASNRKRYAALKADGRLRPAGKKRAPTSRLADTPKMPTNIPGYISAALRRHGRAWRTFNEIPTSHRRQYVAWIDFAKREDTRLRRMKEAIQMLTEGKSLGLK